MIDVKQAVQASAGFARSILEPERIQPMLVEEVERSNTDGREVWLITLSVPAGGLQVFRKEYKTFVVDAETGEVRSMKIRQLAA